MKIVCALQLDLAIAQSASKRAIVVNLNGTSAARLGGLTLAGVSVASLTSYQCVEIVGMPAFLAWMICGWSTFGSGAWLRMIALAFCDSSLGSSPVQLIVWPWFVAIRKSDPLLGDDLLHRPDR